MAQISSKLRSLEGGQVMFWCPGCNESHEVRVDGSMRPNWGYNGNPERPTFTPSILVTSGHYIQPARPGGRCWCTYNAEQVAQGKEPSGFQCRRCHSFVTDGRIQLLADSTH